MMRQDHLDIKRNIKRTLTDEEVPKTDRLKVGFLSPEWAVCDPEWVRSVSGDQRSGTVFDVGTSGRRLSPTLSFVYT